MGLGDWRYRRGHGVVDIGGRHAHLHAVVYHKDLRTRRLASAGDADHLHGWLCSLLLRREPQVQLRTTVTGAIRSIERSE